MLLLLRWIPIILAIVMTLSLIMLIAVMIKNTLENRFDHERRKNKAKAGDLPSDAGVRDLIMHGQLEDAVDLYQRFTGVDAFTAREAIQDMEREIRLSEFDTTVGHILADKGKAAAIQAYQDQTGADFEEALQYIERLARS